MTNKKNRLSKWRKFIKFIETIKIGDEFSRQDLLHYFYSSQPISWITTADTYRLNITKLGFLEKTRRGIYKKKLNLPNVPSTLISKLLSEPAWKDWFIPLHERLGVTEEELKHIKK